MCGCVGRYVTAGGDIVRYSRQDTPELLNASVVGLGCLGIAATVELDIYPSYRAREVVLLLMITHTEGNGVVVMKTHTKGTDVVANDVAYQRQ